MAHGRCPVLGCGYEGPLKGGMCATCYGWQRKNPGKDPATRKRIPQRKNGALLTDLTAAAHAETDECVFLAGYAGRPSVPFNGVTMTASRAVWIIRHGDPGAASVLHRCNGGSGDHGCINVRHLYLGDKSQNIADAVSAGRWKGSDRRGEAVPTHVLTEAEVREIRRRWAAGGVTQKALAAEFGVSRATLSFVVNGKRWAHVG